MPDCIATGAIVFRSASLYSEVAPTLSSMRGLLIIRFAPSRNLTRMPLELVLWSFRESQQPVVGCMQLRSHEIAHGCPQPLRAPAACVRQRQQTGCRNTSEQHVCGGLQQIVNTIVV